VGLNRGSKGRTAGLTSCHSARVSPAAWASRTLPTGPRTQVSSSKSLNARCSRTERSRVSAK
jgi:hypothetical protein